MVLWKRSNCSMLMKWTMTQFVIIEPDRCSSTLLITVSWPKTSSRKDVTQQDEHFIGQMKTRLKLRPNLQRLQDRFVTLFQLLGKLAATFISQSHLFAKTCWTSNCVWILTCVQVSVIFNVSLLLNGNLSARWWNIHSRKNQWIQGLVKKNYLSLCSVTAICTSHWM